MTPDQAIQSCHRRPSGRPCGSAAGTSTRRVAPGSAATARQDAEPVGRFRPDEHGAGSVTLQSDTGEGIDPPPDLLPILESAARLQQLVPDSILVGGTVSARVRGPSHLVRP